MQDYTNERNSYGFTTKQIIMDKFAKREIKFARPTQLVVVHKN